MLLLNDGQISLQVLAIDGPRIKTRVLVGGELGNNKGINRQGGGLSAGALTDKDREDIHLAASLKVDYLAVSFARDAADMNEARTLLRAAGGHALLVAKIERAEAIKNLAEVVRASDAVMVARGDLGVEMGYAELAGLQKQIIQEARHQNRVVIMATQMMESMIVNTIPTRAEVSDVANAVMDGSDAVMLSAETAAGKHPSQGGRSHGADHRRRREVPGRARAHPPAQYRLLRPRERGDRRGGDVHRQPPAREGHRRAHRVGRNGAVDVARALGHSDLRLHAPGGHPLPGDACTAACTPSPTTSPTRTAKCSISRFSGSCSI